MPKAPILKSMRLTDAADDSAHPAPEMDAGQAASIVAAASEDSLELGLVDLGIDPGVDEAVVEAPVPSLTATATSTPAWGEGPAPAWGEGPAPAWGDAVGEMEEELAALDPDAQPALVRALREAS